ncbi:hypothetical protein ACJJJB_07940 [Microbulbifer sp. ANSA001]|uniref:hypothetical protein n=1 Tax=Microbulbifer sp. ANSA001 TaxID=3243358 RepID=UPI004041B5DD
MIWLQSNDKYNELAEYDHEEGTFTIVFRNGLGAKIPIKTVGTFAILSTVFVALYKFGQELYVRVGGQCIPLTDDVIVTVCGEVNSRLLTIKKAGVEVTSLNYTLDVSKIIPGDSTPFVEDEDFDFGLFVSNIATSSKRKRVLLGLD